MTFGRRWMMAAVLVPLLVGGCSEEPEPKIAPPPDSASTSPTPTEPTKQPWEKKSKAGAVAFAEHWVDVFSDAMRSGNTAQLLDLSSPECAICNDFARRLDRINSSGGFYRSTGWRVLATSPVEGLPVGEARVSLRIRQGKETLQESSDSPVVSNAESLATWSANLRWSRGSWAMANLELVE